MKKLTALFTAIIFSTTTTWMTYSYADIGQEVDRWFDDQGYANVTNPQAVETQAGRMYTLGGIQTRNQVKSGFDFVNIQPPSISGGCSGIDVFAGGFGFVNEDQFVESLKAIGQNAKSLAFMIAIKIASAQLEDEIAKIQEWANKFNQFQINSCQAASELLEIGARQVGFTEGCVQLRMERYGEERYKAEYQCKTGGGASDVMSNPNDPEMNKVVLTQGNLAWQVLMQDAYFRNNLELAEIMMNIMGTIIVDSTDQGHGAAPSVTQSVPAALARGVTTERFKGLFNYFYLGKDAPQNIEYYACKDLTSNPTGCQELVEKTIRPGNQGMKDKIDRVLVGISEKVRNGQNLTNEEKGVIANSSLPILHYIKAVTASPQFIQNSSVNVGDDFSTIIAYDLVVNNLKGLIDRANINAQNQKDGLSESQDFKEYAQQLEDVLSQISALERENADRAETAIKMREQIREYEREILSKVSGHYIDAANY